MTVVEMVPIELILSLLSVAKNDAGSSWKTPNYSCGIVNIWDTVTLIKVTYFCFVLDPLLYSS